MNLIKGILIETGEDAQSNLTYLLSPARNRGGGVHTYFEEFISLLETGWILRGVALIHPYEQGSYCLSAETRKIVDYIEKSNYTLSDVEESVKYLKEVLVQISTEDPKQLVGIYSDSNVFHNEREQLEYVNTMFTGEMLGGSDIIFLTALYHIDLPWSVKVLLDCVKNRDNKFYMWAFEYVTGKALPSKFEERKALIESLSPDKFNGPKNMENPTTRIRKVGGKEKYYVLHKYNGDVLGWKEVTAQAFILHGMPFIVEKTEGKKYKIYSQPEGKPLASHETYRGAIETLEIHFHVTGAQAMKLDSKHSYGVTCGIIGMNPRYKYQPFKN